jgi:UDP-glucose 4-epimerase
MTRVVLVTGVSRYLGARFARVLDADPSVARVIGVDVVPSPYDLGGARFVHADIRQPVIAKVIGDSGVDTVVHMNVIATPLGAGGRTTMKEINVIGTMQLLAACQKSPAVRKLVVKSSSAVYGSSPKDPALFSEEMEPKEIPRSGFARDSVEVEGYVRGFARRRPDVNVTTLRLANVLGPGVESPLSTYFSLPAWPTPAGYDARLQLVHEDDAIEMIRRATVQEIPGTYNVAGNGLLLLSQAARRAGRPMLRVPRPLGGWVGESFRRAGVADFSPEQMTFLSFGRGLDCTRLHNEVGFRPRYSTVDTFDDFMSGRRLQRVVPLDVLDEVERCLMAAVRAPRSTTPAHGRAAGGYSHA